jgi:hypothetical protein
MEQDGSYRTVYAARHGNERFSVFGHFCRGMGFVRVWGLELVQDSLTESKTSLFSPFFTFFQLRSTGYAPSKM